MIHIESIQAAIRIAGLDGWLFFDHHRRDPLAYEILGIPFEINPSRRWYYFVPADGEPRKLVHRIESRTLDTLAGEKFSYASWAEQQKVLADMLRGAARIAMQYSPKCAIPSLSLVDAGTIELVRGLGIEVASSADLVQEFQARWTEEQFRAHVRAGKSVDQVRREAFKLIAARVGAGASVSEYDAQQFILRGFEEAGLITNHGPIVATNAHAADPHYEPSRERNSLVGRGDLVLIDLWAKFKEPNSVYYDVTWTGFCGEVIPDGMRNVFEVVRDARKKASDFVIKRVAAREPTAGFQVDDQARGFIEEKGFGQYFFYRTGHSIGIEVHGAGANMDNLESHDERRIIAQTCFSIEPGIYLADFGIRSEVNVYVGADHAMITGEEQEEIVRL